MAGIVIFALTYALISARRLRWLPLDRPAAALLGAVACVAAGVLAPEEALAAVDGSTLLLLLGVMGMGAFLAVDGFFEQLGPRLVAVTVTPARLLGAVVWGAGGLAALITNDAVCVLGAPLVVGLIRRHSLPPLPFLLALATGANTGSVATLVGNPQNMLAGMLGGLEYRDHLLLLGPVAVVGLAVNHALLAWLFRTALAGTRLAAEPPSEPLAGSVRITLAVIAASAVAYTAGTDLAWTAAAGFALLMLVHRRDTRLLWSRIDWSLLLFFASLFIVVEGFNRSGAPEAMFARWPLWPGDESLLAWLRLSGIFLIGSNVVSNVPFILVVDGQMGTLPDSRLGWELLTLGATFAGNLTLLGSVANVIVAEAGRDVGGIGFWEYLRIGVPLASLTTLIGALWLVLASGAR